MSFTKVAPAGIGTEPGTSIRLGDSLLHSTGLDIGTGTGIGVTIRQHGDATFTGIVTAASFSGDITGKATELATNATGTNLTLSGNLGVGGVITYEDVTNIDSVGVITARSGIKIGPTAGVAGTFFADGSYVTAGIITAGSFVGDGSALTGLSGLSVANQADNRLITATGTTDALNAEANLTFDGNDLTVTGTAPAINFIDTDADDYKIHNVQGLLKVTDTTASADRLVINDNGTGYFLSNFQIGSTTTSPGATLHIKTSYPSLKVDSGGHASDAYVRIIAGNAQNSRVDFGDSDDDNIGIIDYDHNGNYMSFTTNTSERLRITSDGKFGFNTNNPLSQVEMHGASIDLNLVDTDSYSAGSNGPGVSLQGNDSGGNRKTFADIHGLSNGSNAGDFRIRTRTGGSLYERLKIDSSGRVILNGAAVGSNEYLTLGPNGSTACDMAFRLNNDNDARIKFYDGGSTLRGLFGYTTYANNSTYPNFHDSFYMQTDPSSNGTLATALRISNSGQFIKPLTYKFLVETNGQSVSGGWAKLTGLTIDSSYSTGVSNGSYWSNSNSRFTAPVSGTYLFFIGGFSSTAEGGGTNHRYMYIFQVNGSGLKYGFGGNYSDNNTPMAGGAMHIPLNVNDYVEVQYYTAISATWGAGHRFFWGGYFLG